MKSIIIIASIFLFLSCGKNNNNKEAAAWVDPFIGTDGIVHTFPGATVPFGMIQLSPDCDNKGWNWCSGYHSSDTTVMGFSHNHLSGTGWSDLGDILLMATVGKVKTEPGDKSDPIEGYRSRISHDSLNEKAQAGYYMVNLLDYNIKAEMTASQRVGFHRYTFPETDSANVIIDPRNKIFGKVFDTQVDIINDTTVQGWCYSTGWGGKRNVYFTAVFSKAFDKSEGGKVGYVSFKMNKDEALEVKVALSHVCQDGSKLNLSSADTLNFDKARKNAFKNWNKNLNRYVFEGTEKQKRMLYTGLYHVMLQPNLNMDVDSMYVAGGVSGTEKSSGKTYKAKGFNNYSTFSFWDTFRAANVLLTLTNHDVVADIANSLISRYENGGHLPLWELLGYDNTCMIGYPAVAILGDAIMKDIPGFDYQRAYAAMKDAAFNPYISSSDGESGLKQYIETGYVPYPVQASVSKTMEYSYYDWVLSRVAEKLGKHQDAEMFKKRSTSFLNHWNKDKQLMYPKDDKGKWIEPSLISWESLKPHYVSGNIWAYSYFYPHAVDDAISIFGGAGKFIESMEKMLKTPLQMEGEQHLDISGFIGHYGHGDEPGHQFLYMFTMAGEPQKASFWINKVVNEYYRDSRDGMPNNDDCGQMSAWYIFSSLGFYPVCPADNRYYIGTPLIPYAKIRLASGKTFEMQANELNDENMYVQSVKLNGSFLKRGYITHQEIMEGAKLEFFMGKEEKNWLK